MEAMSLVQRYEKPNVFLTMTCNPNWPEIKHELRHNNEIQNRPNLLVRIFRARLEELKIDLVKRKLLAPIVAYVYVIEFQKRGLLYAHFLLIFKPNFKIKNSLQVDEIVSCEIPDKNKYPHLHSTVVKYMMHDPCGELNLKNVCMEKNDVCKNKYPREFVQYTSLGNDSYPHYKRRNDGVTVKVRGCMLDNRWVVPYNPYILAKYDCHINLEVCSSIKAIKYLYKYIYKGHDHIHFTVNKETNEHFVYEITNYQTARWISPPEAMWRIFSFDLFDMSPVVICLQLYTEDAQMATYNESDDLSKVINREFIHRTMLTEFFKMNISDEKARNLLYKEFPTYFVWNAFMRIWTPRKKKNVMGRIVAANPSEGERYFLRVSLNHIKRPKSFENLRTVNGVILSTYREVAVLYGLLSGNNYFESCLTGAVVYQMPILLRRLFANVLTLCCPANPRNLWDKFKGFMMEDYLHNGISQQNAKMRALHYINSFLKGVGKNVTDFGLVDFNLNVTNDDSFQTMIAEEMTNINVESDINYNKSLNRKQQNAYDIILDCVLNDKNGMFFIDGPGGTEKIYLYKALLAAIRSRNLITLVTTSFGRAASLLPIGRTGHS
ncbi:uncharacterized protein LOC111374750 [Olea europaea var. sylvestris]|uniref:uncharacterized protein LOC111374750 n=1 Tax=Olea europaea var. sylvestris TaxID=158386 RepID=UPI000C1D58D0|nr:uncharacterized protein LOC111374750 [Olea europaea var. sylvestris]